MKTEYKYYYVHQDGLNGRDYLVKAYSGGQAMVAANVNRNNPSSTVKRIHKKTYTTAKRILGKYRNYKII